ncbi:hypothetical protein [Streptomyces sp. NPDC058674]|uniref:hypothetical protein n=1 Tax=Streptomyces sp. NPDC058674 TaxID=3346592 RepID=UPI00364EAD8D
MGGAAPPPRSCFAGRPLLRPAAIGESPAPKKAATKKAPIRKSAAKKSSAAPVKKTVAKREPPRSA